MYLPISKIFKNITLKAILLLSLTPLVAAEVMQVPKAETVRAVYNYYQNGTHPIVSQSISCKAIGDTQPNRFECLDSVDTSKPLAAFSSVYHWISLFIPTPFDGAVEYRFFYQDKLVKSSRVNVAPSMRYRVWKLMPTNQSGEWKVEIVSISQSDDIEESILTKSYTVE